ncbi:MAG: hypothetical protein ACQERX_03455, partial [Bacillota bacterium]
YAFNILKAAFWEYLLLINPIQAASEIINQAFKPINLNWKYYFSLVYLIIGGILIYKYLVLTKFKNYAVSISGV